MSAPTSRNSPRSGSISGDALGFGFDGLEDLIRAWASGLKPDPYLTVSEWADRYRMLASRASAEPGRYRTRRTPYMREIMDALSSGGPGTARRFHEGSAGGGSACGGHAHPHAVWLGDHELACGRRPALRRERTYLPRASRR